jgi:hypothetical protein
MTGRVVESSGYGWFRLVCSLSAKTFRVRLGDMRVVSSRDVAASGSLSPKAKGVKNRQSKISRCEAETTQYEMFDEIDAQDIEDDWYVQKLLLLCSYSILNLHS